MNKKKLKKIVKRKIDFIRMPIQNTLLNPTYRRNKEYRNYYESLPIEKNTILYESRDGQNITDNPYAIFKFLLNNPAYKHLKHIWTIQKPEELKIVMDEYKNYDNVSFVVRNTKEYTKILATSKYLISNATFQSFVVPREEQIYINTWHGTPLKTMGFKIPGNPSNSKNVVRNFLSADYLISPNRHTTEMYTDSYKMEGLYSGSIIEDGYPRNDLTLNTDKTYIQNKLISYNLSIDESKKTVLYAPTWKGTSITKAKNDMEQIISDMKKLENNIGNEYNILIKVHPYLYSTAKKYDEIKNILIPDYADTNEVLSMVDVLITDYSSIFFDFLVTGKPILFYVWDAESYVQERGSYFLLDELPGPTLYTISELIDAFENKERYKEETESKYQQFRDKFTPYDDGNTTERLVNFIFKNQYSEQMNIIKDLDKKKEKILVYPGGMMNNGITTSFINLVNNIDYTKYDVTCFMKNPNKAEVLNNISKINKNVRLLFRNGVAVYNTSEIYLDKAVQNRGIHSSFMKKMYPESAYKREVKRYFGKSKFDIAIDFSGYSLFWAKYIVAVDAHKKICFMHNDIYTERFKEIKGKHPHMVNLGGLFSIYDKFDKLVSVSKGTMELNKKNLSQYAKPEKFDYVMNSINPEKIFEGSKSENYKSLSPVNEFEDNIVYKNERMIARAVINKPSELAILNNVLDNKSTRIIAPAKEYVNKEVTVIWKTESKEGNYYKFIYDNSIIGWLHEDAFTLLPDSVIDEKKVNRVVRLSRTKGNAIWNKPYRVYNTSRVSYSGLYKNMAVEVDKEVKTEHGMYSHFKLFNEVIGWIDSSALKTIKDYTDSVMSSEEIKNEKEHILNENYTKYKDIADKFHHRTLRHRNIKNVAIVRDLLDYQILSALPSNPKAKIIYNYTEYLNKKVELTQRVITKENVYYLIYFEGKKLGWINRKALEVSSSIEIIEEKDTKKIAEIDMNKENCEIWTKPFGMENSEVVISGKFSFEEKFEIVKEVRTQNGKYSKLIQNNKEIGWINNKFLMNVKELGIKVGGTFIPEPDPSNINFVNMGRMSPEKAQGNLIEAFAIFNKEISNSRLYIIGTGILYKDLMEQILELGLREKVFLVGQLENPFKLLKNCDCFVLSSHYEGQPMVLLEAMTLGLSIIATDIIANRTVLENGKYGLLVDDSVNGLYEGLYKFGNNHKQKLGHNFDYDEYNQEAMNSFYKVLS